jgi:hypothetical protein
MTSVNSLYQELQEINQVTSLNCDTIFLSRSIPSLIPLSNQTKGMLYICGRTILNNYLDYKIDHIISLIPLQTPLFSIKHDIFEIEDSPNSNVVKKFEHNIDKLLYSIFSSLEEGKRVCVHCNAGVSRSVTLVCAYLIKYEKMNWIEAINHIRKVRPYICPNRGFLELLSQI